MTLRRSIFIVMVCLASAVPVFSQSDDPPGVPAKPIQAEFVRAVLETTLEHHIEPPTRQQLIFDFLTHVRSKRGYPSSRNLSSQISDISNVDELYRFLQTQLDECRFYESPDSDQLLLSGLGASLSGSVKLVPRKDQVVNEQLAANQYVGIGIQIADKMKVVSAFEGGPAHKAGLQANDTIESIDGKPTKGEPLATSVERLRGPVGTTVSLMARAPGQTAREIIIERRVVPLKTVERVTDASIRDDFGVIHILQITSSTVSDLSKLIEALPGSIQTVVLDLSGAAVSETNIGLHSTHLLADALLDECELGQLASRTGARKLRSEDGNILGGRELVFFYRPGTDNYIDWLAANLNSQGRYVCFEKNNDQVVRVWDKNARALITTQIGFDANGIGAYETFAIDDDYYLTLMSKWLTANVPRGQAVLDLKKLIEKPSQAAKP